MKIVNLDDLEPLARGVLPQPTFDYYAGGAEDELTLRRNRAAFGAVSLHYRVLRAVGQRDLRTRLLGLDLSMPVVIAPTAFQRMAHPDGELATARAAGAAGTLMMVSTNATTSLEQIAAAATGPLWFQLYMYQDRAITADLVARAAAAGYKAIVVTVDTPVLGRRERDVRNDFQLPPGLVMANFVQRSDQELPDQASADEDSRLAAYASANYKFDLGWDDIAWLRGATSLPVLIKGVVRPDDAALAPEHGVAGVVVSNHGGRQLDTAPAPIEVLPQIAAALDGRCALIMDGGVRRGTDVVKALAYGADAVAIGRPVLWGLALGGETGVAAVLEHLRAELEVALALVGATKLADLDRGLVTP